MKVRRGYRWAFRSNDVVRLMARCFDEEESFGIVTTDNLIVCARRCAHGRIVWSETDVRDHSGVVIVQRIVLP